MVTHMKTTIDIADGLLLRAKDLAKRRGTTLRGVMEGALAKELEADQEPKKEVTLTTVKGRGLSADYEQGGWDRIAEEIY